MIAIADVRMRSERMVQLRQVLEEDDAERRAAGRLSYFDWDKPWDCVFLAAAQDTEFWDTEVREKATAFTTYIVNLPEREGEGCSPEAGQAHAADSNVQPREGQSPPPPRARQPGGARRPWGEGKTNKARRRAKARAVCPSMRIRIQPGARGCIQYLDGLHGPLDRGAGRRPREAQICWQWQWMAGCSSECPHGRRHVCIVCDGDHRGVECIAHDSDTGKLAKRRRALIKRLTRGPGPSGSRRRPYLPYIRRGE